MTSGFGRLVTALRVAAAALFANREALAHYEAAASFAAPDRGGRAVPRRGERTRLCAAIDSGVAAAVPVVYLFNPSYSYAYRTALNGFFPNAFNPTWNAYAWSR